MVVPHAHFPIVNYEVVDDVRLVLVGMHIQWLDVVLHEKGRSLLGL